MFKKKIAFLCISLFFYACGNTENKTNDCKNKIDVSNIKIKTEVIRFEKELFAQKDSNAIQNILKKYPLMRDRFFGIKFSKDSLKEEKKLIASLTKMVNEKHLDTLYNDCQKAFGDFKEIENEFAEAFKHIKYYFPNFKTPTIYTTITGLKSFGGLEFYVDKDMIVISLEFFLGKNVRYRPRREEYPDYIWQHYHQKSIVPFCLLFMANGYNRSDLNDKSMVADMVFYGKSLEFVKRAVPCMPDSLLLRYSQQQIRNINDQKNRSFLWNHFLEKKLLFSNKDLDKKAYLEDRPYIAEINKECPPRIGQWFGWRIIQNYLQKNKDVNFQKLMKNQNAQEIFEKAGYNGQ
ncbi:MAG: hypothetical protein EAZ85_05180 [Bacteroidetes bacterium]|nr:MAG: hypothetical protein EAZ85_05180 [Bacteroidota bacterium]TAG86309.1 MAG: hypothetical protein EAZ20_13080 [Bacteroidota bacterium]